MASSSAMKQAFVVGGGAARAAIPSKVKARLSKYSRPETGSVAQRLAAKAAVAQAAKEAAAGASRRRAEQAKARGDRARQAAKTAALSIAEEHSHRMEGAKERRARHVAKTVFKAADDTMRVKAAAAASPLKQQRKADQLARKQQEAAALAASALAERKARASAVAERHAAVVSRVRAQREQRREELQQRIRSKTENADATRLTMLGLTMGRNMARTLHVIAVNEHLSLYDEMATRYSRARIDATLRRAEINREAHINEIREKAKSVWDNAQAKAESAREELQQSLEMTSATLENRMQRAALRKRLVRKGELKDMEKLSICGEFIIGLDGSWREVPQHFRADLKLSPPPSPEPSGSSEEWELVGSALSTA